LDNQTKFPSVFQSRHTGRTHWLAVSLNVSGQAKIDSQTKVVKKEKMENYKKNIMNLGISIADKEDLKQILELQKECYQIEAELHNDYNIPPLTQSILSINEEFDEGVSFLKGLVDGQLVGSVRGQIKNNTAYVGRLMVKDEFQNNGFGQALMKKIEDDLKNCNRYELFTGHKSEKNIKLYQKLGYNEIKRQYINDNLTLVYLEKTQK
jgi:ribosomal protein S18 acetylase RimI-like enzyme